MSDDHIEQSSAPLIEHLIELRTRLVYSLIALGAMTVICFVFRFQLWDFLSGPLLAADPDAKVVSLNPQEVFFSIMNVALWGGFFLSFPIIAYQAWAFVAPGLYKNEQGAFLPFLVATPFLFITGAALAYYLVIPLALDFLISFAEGTSREGGIEIENENRFSEFIGFIKVMLLAFGMAFQLPVLLTLMGRVGLLTSDQLSRGRKYAVVGIAAMAALVTPPDVISQFLLGIPVYILYEISIILVRRFEEKRAAEDEWDDDEDFEDDDLDDEAAEKGV
ncbi:MAG: twin-arginine translocase subunit TatC [Pseudomonadota bacterium]